MLMHFTNISMKSVQLCSSRKDLMDVKADVILRVLPRYDNFDLDMRIERRTLA